MNKKELNEVNDFFDNAYLTGKKTGSGIVVSQVLGWIHENREEKNAKILLKKLEEFILNIE